VHLSIFDNKTIISRDSKKVSATINNGDKKIVVENMKKAEEFLSAAPYGGFSFGAEGGLACPA
jgi:uncharacterized protein YabE (DUF348 family)